MKYIVYIIALINCKDISCPDNKPGCMVGHSICDTDTLWSKKFFTLKDAKIFSDTLHIPFSQFAIIDSLNK